MQCDWKPFGLLTEIFGNVNGRLYFNGKLPNRDNVFNALCPFSCTKARVS